MWRKVMMFGALVTGIGILLLINYFTAEDGHLRHMARGIGSVMTGIVLMAAGTFGHVIQKLVFRSATGDDSSITTE